MSSQVKDLNPYHYVPTFYVCVIYLVFFGFSTALHLGQAIRSRLWWLLPTAFICGIGETIGWAARLWSSKNPYLLTPFLMQISTTIIAPTFLSAANFIILGMVVNQIGTHYSRISPKAYSIVFVSADVVSLVIQAIGGGAASAAAHNHKSADKGGHVMLVGIILQMAAITIYSLLAAEVMVRYSINRPWRKVTPPADTRPGAHSPSSTLNGERVPMNPKMKLMVLGLGISTLFLFIRSVYRTIELIDGWSGRIISTQSLFNALDGMPICIAMYSLNIFHPGWLIDRTEKVETADTEKSDVAV